MVDQINQAIDVVIPWMNEADGCEDEYEKIIEISRYKTNARPLYRIHRKKDIELIRRRLRAKNRILWRAYHTHAYYSCDTSEVQQNVQEHMMRTGAYCFIMHSNETNQYYTNTYLNDINQRITTILNNLLHDQWITYRQWQQMIEHRFKGTFDSLYFLPDTRKKNIPFHPMVAFRHRVTFEMSCFLNGLIRAIYNQVTCSTTFIRGADAINAVEDYAKQGLLQANTLFTTIHIHDLCTIFPHKQTIEVLQRFLHTYASGGQIQGVTIQTIMTLVRLFLDNQYFLYDNTLYQQIRGGGSNSPMTTLLANIYIYEWQQKLVNISHEKNELFGRCLDELFLTWNESEDKLYDILNAINRRYPHIRMTITMGDNINYLDANITHIYGDLITKVAKDVDTEPYSLPYVFGHRRDDYSSLLRAAMIRAIRCCSELSEFMNEYDDIQLSFRHNGFSHNLILHNIQLFLTEFDADELKLHEDEASYHPYFYDNLREHVLKYIQQGKLAKIQR